MERAMEHRHAHRTLLERAGGNFILATKYPPKFTMGQMVGKAKTAMEKCGLFQLHLNEWSQFTLVNQDWDNMKQHFGETYKTY